MQLVRKFLARNIFPLLFRLFPIKKKRVVFSSFGGRNYSGNPRIISEALQQKKLGYEQVWIIKKDVSVELPAHIKRVAADSLLASYYLYTAKFWIDDSRKTIVYPKRSKQVYFQTWHGTPLKKIEFDATDKLPQHYLNYAKCDSASISYLLSGNRYSTERYPQAFAIASEKILNIGTPRNDNLVQLAKRQPVQNFGDKSQLIMLFAPTFRNTFADNGIPQLKRLEVKKLHEYFAAQGIGLKFLVKFHPNVNAQLAQDSTNQQYLAEHQIELVEDGILLEDLFGQIDLLITDYSSIFFDYALLHKPLILFNYDEAEYIQERGFYVSLSELPVPVAKDATALLTIFQQQQTELLASADRLLDYLGNYEQGTSTDKVIELLLKEADRP